MSLDPWGDWAPITCACGFLQVPIERADTAMHNWMKQREGVGPRGFATQSVTSRYPEVLRELEPLVMVGRRRELLIECRGNWTAYFDNGARGTDGSSAVGHLCKELACYGIAICDQPHTAKGNTGIAGATIFEYFGPHRTDWLNYVRSVAVAYDGRKWEFSAAGEAKPFEHLDRYGARPVRERFTSAMLVKYCEALGVRPYDPDFYAERAILFVQAGTVKPPNVEVSLADARAWLGLGR